MITTTAAGRSAFVLAIAAAATAVIAAMMAGRALAQGDQTTVFSTSTSIASGTEGFVLTDTYAYVDIMGDNMVAVDAPDGWCCQC